MTGKLLRFSRPFGTNNPLQPAEPSDESLGYFQRSLRDPNADVNER
jgi:hypothetical protein